jgi:hypothetical protein
LKGPMTAAAKIIRAQLIGHDEKDVLDARHILTLVLPLDHINCEIRAHDAFDGFLVKVFDNENQP